MKIALFDFCETLVSFQTADKYVLFVQSESEVSNKMLKKTYDFCRRHQLMRLPRKLFPKSAIDKRLILLQMRGRTKLEMEKLAERYYAEEIRPALVPEVMNALKEKQDAGFKIFLVSGGYDIYLKLFAREFNIDGIISSKIEFKNGICTGKMFGPDCMSFNKINYILGTIADNDFSGWYAYSDSISDLPMLNLVGNPVVVSRNKPQEWAENENFSQIIWN